MPITAMDLDLHLFRNSQGLQAGCDAVPSENCPSCGYLIVVANLATNFQDLVANAENLGALVPVLGAILGPASTCGIWSIIGYNHPISFLIP